MQRPLPPSRFALLAAAFEGGIALVAVAVGWLVGRPPLASFIWDPWALLLTPLTLLPPLAVLALCLWQRIGLFAPVRRVIDETLVPLFRPCGLLELAAISLLAGLGEEMLFRGVLQAGLADWLAGLFGAGQSVRQGVLTADWLAAGAIALLFGAVHWVNTGYAILAALIGLYLAWLWIFTGNLMYPVVVHGLYDFLALVYLIKVRARRV
jgi:uncharacterized protein